MDELNLGDPFLRSHDYRSYPLSKENFHTITKGDSDRILSFIDGGNQELVGAPNFSIQLNRTYFNIFEKRRIIQPHNLSNRVEFLSLTLAEFKGETILYHTSLFPMSGVSPSNLPEDADLSFDSSDRRLMIGNSRADIGRVASIARRFAEWRFAQRIVENELEEGDILVMDGSLRTAFPNEPSYAKAAYEAAYGKKVIFSGLSKTSRLFTTTGLSLLGAVRKLAQDNAINDAWYYHPVAESISPERGGVIFLLKLSDMSQRIFRYEINSQQAKVASSVELNEILSALSQNSNDLTFPGYPYGLVDADDNARVRNEELETYRVMLLSEISKLGAAGKLQRHMESIDAHSVMNLLREAA